MRGLERSLLSFLDAPVVVGDPEGRAVYANPAFEASFGRTTAHALGRPLAELFEGGGREAVLRAVAAVCDGGASVRFRVREREVGFAAVASPIVAEDARVGVVILLKEEVEGVERLLSLHRDLQDPLDELASALDALLEQTGGRRNQRYRTLVEDGLRAQARVRKWSEEMRALLAGAPPRSERFDPAEVVRRVAERAAGQGEGRPPVSLLTAPALPFVQGDAARLEAVLGRMVARRLCAEPAPERLILGARRVEAAGSCAVLISLTEHFASGAASGLPDPPELQEAVAALGAILHVSADPALGRTTLVRLALVDP